jgi:prepilin-type N-terminal cleavage/methylation domain-containing protein
MNSRRGFTLVELLVVIAIIAILVALLLPAVQSSREAGRRASCSNKLRQLALGVLNFESAQRRYPSGGETKATDCPLSGSSAVDGGPSWSVLILPYCEGQAIYDSFDMAASFSAMSWDDGLANFPRQFRPNSAFQCPSDPNSRADACNTNFFACQGGGATPACQSQPGRVFFNNGLFFNNSRIRVKDVADGTTHVALLGETKYAPHPDYTTKTLTSNPPRGLPHMSWASALRVYTSFGIPLGLGATMRGINSSRFDPAAGGGEYLSTPTSTFGSNHPGGAMFARADGAVTFVFEGIDLALYRSFGQRNSGQTKGGF